MNINEVPGAKLYLATCSTVSGHRTTTNQILVGWWTILSAEAPLMCQPRATLWSETDRWSKARQWLTQTNGLWYTGHGWYYSLCSEPWSPTGTPSVCPVPELQMWRRASQNYRWHNHKCRGFIYKMYFGVISWLDIQNLFMSQELFRTIFLADWRAYIIILQPIIK